jgi:hypothetical protein
VVSSLLASRRRFALAVGLSLAVHVLLFTLPPHTPRTPAMGGAPPPMQVTLVEAPSPVPDAAPPPAVPPPSTAPSAPSTPRVLASREPAKKAAPPLPAAEPTPPPPVPPQPPPPQFDMAALIASRQAQRRAADAAAARGPKASPDPSPADNALASINRNLQTLKPEEGVGGLFQILRKGSLSASSRSTATSPSATSAGAR